MQRDTIAIENEDFLSRQLITYIGNKRALLGFIGHGIEIIMNKLGKTKLSSFDVFSGSGIVSRFLKQYSSTLITNDIEKYTEVINKCYLANPSEIDIPRIQTIHQSLVEKLNEKSLRTGFINELYAPKNEDSILRHDRVFYTKRNAMYLDTARQYMDEVPSEIRHFLLAPLLSEASVHANTSGVFKGFYKNSATGIGQFGGNNRDALTRILGNIELPFPVFSRFECDVRIHNRDSNELIKSIEEVDLAYIDPPYNQHPYGSNYFMLNLLVDYRRPAEISHVSGIPKDWKRSHYNKSKYAFDALSSLVSNIKAKYILISFNSDGFIDKPRMLALLECTGRVGVLETKYNTFRGSRNLAKRDIHVSEYLYLVEKS
jgi:adenine-specific DNA-methyltransferase